MCKNKMTNTKVCLLRWSYFPVNTRFSDQKKDSEGVEMGVAGSVSLLQNVTLSTQAHFKFGLESDKRGLCICSSFDQMVRVLIVTKLHKIWSLDLKPSKRILREAIEYVLQDPLTLTEQSAIWLTEKASDTNLWASLSLAMKVTAAWPASWLGGGLLLHMGRQGLQRQFCSSALHF